MHREKLTFFLNLLFLQRSQFMNMRALEEAVQPVLSL